MSTIYGHRPKPRRYRPRHRPAVVHNRRGLAVVAGLAAFELAGTAAVVVARW